MIEEQVKQETVKPELHTMSIKEIFFKYLRFWPLFVISLLLAMAGSWAYLRWATKIYRASGVLLVHVDKKTSGLDKLDLAMTVDPMKDVQTEIEILKSRPMMERVVNALNLNFNYFVKGSLKETNAYKDLPFQLEVVKQTTSNPFSINIHFQNQQSFKIDEGPRVYAFGQEFNTPYGVFKLERTGSADLPRECRIAWNPTLYQAMAYVGSLQIVPKVGTGVLTISMESTSPRLATDIVNQLMVEYGKVNIEEKNVTTHQKLKFIDERIELMLHQLDSINDRLVAFREKYRIVDPQMQSEAYLSRIENNLEKLNEQRVQMQNIHKLETYLARNSSDAPVPSSLGVDDPTLNKLIEAYNEVQIERKQLLENAPPGNLLVRQTTDKAENLRQKILENIRNIKSAFSTVVGSLQSTSGSAMSQVANIPAHERELQDIKRDMESKLVIYNTMLASREQAAIALASTISNTKIVQEALPDPTPVKPNPRAVQIMALLIGLLIPVGIIILIEVLNDKITSRHEIEKLTEATILAEIGHSTDNEALVVTRANRKVIAEQFRILRSNLQFVLRNIEKPVILVTSSSSGEGKSFISTNTGAVISLSGQKTIVLEFDIRKPKVLSHLGIQKRQGLTNYLLGTVPAESLPVAVPGYDQLYVLPCGPLPPNPAELLLDPKLDELFAYLKQHFDVIIMDTAPVGMVSDALTLSRFADCTLFVVREKHTLKKQVAMIDEYYREGRLPKISIVVNDAQNRTGSYGSATGSGYFDEEQPAKSTVNRWFSWLGKNGTVKKTKTTGV